MGKIMTDLYLIQVGKELLLRETSTADLEQLVAVIEANKGFFRTVDFWMAETLVREHVFELVKKAEKSKKEKTGARFCLWDGNDLLGQFNIFDLDRQHRKAQVGYWLAEKYNGKGYARKALNSLVEFGFNVLNLHRLEATTATTNASSIRLLERIGFKREGLLRECFRINDRFVDDYLYSLLSTDRRD
jgi:RimJ/RimL family protein N-acetyltransferase